jgi:ABC-type nitrate/sulfonate/bicarbonate transport system permease component
MILSGQLLLDILASLRRAFIGFVVGSFLAVCLGLLTGRIAAFDNSIGEVIRILRPIPSIALVPLAIVWFGLGELSKCLLVIWGVFFPVWMSTHAGATEVEQNVIWAAQSLGASRFRMLIEVILPSSFPYIIAGMRTGVATAFVVLISAEMAGSFVGLGYRIYASHLVFRVDKMLVGIIVLGILGAATDQIFAALSRRVPWRGHDST